MDGILDSSLPDDAQAAEIAARNAVTANPRDQRAQQALCEMLVRQNRLAEAAAALRKAVIWLPDVPSLRIQLAFVQARQGQHAAARQTLAQAAEHLPPGSPIHDEIVQAAGAALAMPAPHEATGPDGHLKPLVIKPIMPAAPPQGRDVALGLDDVASMGIADLVRAGQAARIDNADMEFAEEEPPAPAAFPRPRRALIWVLAALSALVGVAVWQAASRMTERLNSGSSETRFPAPAVKPPARLPAPAAKAPPPKSVEAPKPLALQPADLSALPDGAEPIVTLAVVTGDEDARQRLPDIGRRIRALGYIVSDQIVTVPASSTGGITYWFAEDKEAALAIAKTLGESAGAVAQTHPPQGEAAPVPGAITIILAPTASPRR